MNLHQLFNVLIFYSVINTLNLKEMDSQKVCSKFLNKNQPDKKLFKEDQQFFYTFPQKKIVCIQFILYDSTLQKK